MTDRIVAQPGERLDFAYRISDGGDLPKYRAAVGDLERPVRTRPYLVVPAFPGDLGQRPVDDAAAARTAAVWLFTGDGEAVSRVVPGEAYRMKARVMNIGAAASFAGVAEFYVGPAARFDALATSSSSSRMPVLGICGFSAAPGKGVEVECPVPWIPQNAANLTGMSAVVQAYDIVLDPLTHRFDARKDRHVARVDIAGLVERVWDFNGTWRGAQRLAIAAVGGSRPIKLVIVHREGVGARVDMYGTDWETVGLDRRDRWPRDPEQWLPVHANTLTWNEVSAPEATDSQHAVPISSETRYTARLVGPDRLQLSIFHRATHERNRVGPVQTPITVAYQAELLRV
jgi:hypothetical protein